MRRETSTGPCPSQLCVHFFPPSLPRSQAGFEVRHARALRTNFLNSLFFIIISSSLHHQHHILFLLLLLLLLLFLPPPKANWNKLVLLVCSAFGIFRINTGAPIKVECRTFFAVIGPWNDILCFVDKFLFQFCCLPKSENVRNHSKNTHKTPTFYIRDVIYYVTLKIFRIVLGPIFVTPGLQPVIIFFSQSVT